VYRGEGEGKWEGRRKDKRKALALILQRALVNVDISIQGRDLISVYLQN
jgi:hypothetical protein